MIKPSKKWIKKSLLYKRAARDYNNLDFSNEAAMEMFKFESTGNGDISIEGFNTIDKKCNGYAVGKKWLDVNISNWKEAIKDGWLRIDDLVTDGWPKDWLIKILKDKHEKVH